MKERQELEHRKEEGRPVCDGFDSGSDMDSGESTEVSEVDTSSSEVSIDETGGEA